MKEDRYLVVVALEGADYFAINIDGTEEYKVHVDGKNYFYKNIFVAAEKFLEKYRDDPRHDEVLDEFVKASDLIGKWMSEDNIPDYMCVSRSA